MPRAKIFWRASRAKKSTLELQKPPLRVVFVQIRIFDRIFYTIYMVFPPPTGGVSKSDAPNNSKILGMERQPLFGTSAQCTQRVKMAVKTSKNRLFQI